MYTEMHLSEELQKKWKPVLEHENIAPITDPYKKAVCAILLENQEKAVKEERLIMSEANVVGAGMSPTVPGGEGQFQGMDPVLIALVRRTMPNLMAYDVLGVQPMSGPTGLIFAMRSRYVDRDNNTRPESFYNESDTSFSGMGTHGSTNPFAGNVARAIVADDIVVSGGSLSGGGTASANGQYYGLGYSVGDLVLDDDVHSHTSGKGAGVDHAERLGARNASGGFVGSNDLGQGGDFNEMAFSIERVTVTAESRALKAEYTTELAQDLKAVHGLDAESELSNILSTEIVSEINREVIRTVYGAAKLGAQSGTKTKGIFDLTEDADGRWSVEKFKGLMFQLEREMNTIARLTRRGKANILICSSDVASALSMAGVLDFNPALSSNNSLTPDDTGNTFVGVLNGRLKVFIDPYFDSGGAYEMACLAYKGTSPYDAGIFYCPYVPLQMVRAVGHETFQPKIGFKTRYGLASNPFARGADAGSGLTARSNVYYRLFRIDHLMTVQP
jgi:hypothetical protein